MTTAKQIIDSLNCHPEEWSVDEYTIQHASGLSVWIKGRPLMCWLYKPTEQRFSFFDRFRVSTAVNEWISWKAGQDLNPKIKFKPPQGATEL